MSRERVGRRSRRKAARSDSPPPVRRRAGGRPGIDEASASTRWAAIVVVAAIVVGLLVAGGGDGSGARAELAQQRAPLATAGDDEALTSTWYCAGGTLGEETFADHTVVLANPGPVEAMVDLTSFAVVAPEPIVVDLDTSEDIAADLVLEAPEVAPAAQVTTPVVVPPASVQRIRIADLEGIAGDTVAVLVESDAGSLIAEHIVSGPDGAAMAPCASTSADRWVFAGGTTRRQARQVLSVFNPFPGDAVVDVTFTTDGARRSPQIYDGLVVPSGSVLPIDITGVVTLFDVVSADVTVRTGRVVTDRLVTFAADAGAGGLSTASGASVPAGTWVFGARSDAPVADAIVVYNPGEREAVVDIEVRLDRPDENGFIEPIGITVRAGRTEVVLLAGDAERIGQARLVDATDRLPEGVDYWAAVRSINGVAVVADRISVGPPDAPADAAVSPGVAAAATRHLTTSGDGVGEIVLVNPASDRIAAISMTAHVDGAVFELAGTEVAPLGRTVIDLAALGVPADAVVVIDATEPVVGERRVAIGSAGLTSSPTVPVATTVTGIDLPVG
ncbi:MAG: DUF5719 family protein [Acidimicrobiales bacterium]